MIVKDFFMKFQIIALQYEKKIEEDKVMPK